MQNVIEGNNRRIAKNTLLLYMRQLLVMVITLYTSRVVLNVLGETDYGVYNVVGGVVTMFSFLTSTLASASQRYLSYDLASADSQKLKETFGLIMFTYIVMAMASILMIEMVAVWFVNEKMTIPEERLYAANWVLQFSILTYIIHVLSSPFLSAIIAHENMNVYAYISILDVFLKLFMVFILRMVVFDKLILYSILMFLCSLCITLCYVIYCMRNYVESHFLFHYDKRRLREMISYAFWNVIGTIAGLLRSQGVNILLNLFFSPAINAARAIAYQINNAVNSFSQNFYTAVRPQIVKNYASHQFECMNTLIMRSSRLAFYLLLIISLPVIINASLVLKIWLGSPPEYTVIFVQLILVNALIEVFNLPLAAGVQASGNIKSYQMTIFSINLLNLPISYLMLYNGFSPETTVYVSIILALLSFIPRLIISHRRYSIPIFDYVKFVLFRACVVALICYSCCKLLSIIVDSNNSIGGFLLSVICSIIMQLFVIFLVGLTHVERIMVKKIVLNGVRKVIRYDS